MMTHPIILIDAREKKCLAIPPYLHFFPDNRHNRPELIKLQTRKQVLDAGDYLLSAFDFPLNLYCTSNAGAVETKRTFSEIADNLFDYRHRGRFDRALAKLRTCFRFPLLIVEGGLTTLATQSYSKVPPGALQDAFISAMMRHNIPYLLTPSNTPTQRRLLAEYVARFLLNAHRQPQ